MSTSRLCPWTAGTALTMVLCASAGAFTTEKKKPVPAARAMLGAFKTAIELYRVDHDGAVPPSLQALLTPPRSTDPARKKWKGPYLPDVTTVPPDPWGHSYLYRLLSTKDSTYEILSYGADGRKGGKGDAADLSVRGG